MKSRASIKHSTQMRTSWTSTIDYRDPKNNGHSLHEPLLGKTGLLKAQDN
jgi:hypothetical protein